jgi:hypothetical protein
MVFLFLYLDDQGLFLILQSFDWLAAFHLATISDGKLPTQIEG